MFVISATTVFTLPLFLSSTFATWSDNLVSLHRNVAFVRFSDVALSNELVFSADFRFRLGVLLSYVSL